MISNMIFITCFHGTIEDTLVKFSDNIVLLVCYRMDPRMERGLSNQGIVFKYGSC